MKIYFNEKVKYEPWGGGIHFLARFIEYLRERKIECIFKLKRNIDIIFIFKNNIDLDPKLIKYLKRNPNTKVLQRINISDISKKVDFQDRIVLKINKIANKTVFISNWLAEYYIQKGFYKPYNVIYNGCNPYYFFPEENKRFNLSMIRLVTHHWSSNWMKGFDVYMKLDKLLNRMNNIKFTFIGRYNKKYHPENTTLIEPLYGIELGNELRKHDMYITAARWEACGMHHIEGAMCGLPVLFHKDGGGINELCKNYGYEYYNILTLMEGIKIIQENYEQYKRKIPYDYLNDKRCFEEYYKLLDDMI